jgi:hypothetical protein
MMDNEAPAAEAEMESAGIGDILAGDQSAPAPKVEQPKAEAAPAAEAAAPEVKPETKPEAEQPFWYRKRLKEIEQRAKQAEQRAQELEARQPQHQLPDPRQDPLTYFETQRVMDRLERSEDRFVDKHGEPELESVKEWLTTRPDIEAWAIQQRHPWAAAHQQYQREKLSAEIGDDPNAWREAERERLRAEILAEMPSAPMAPQRPNIPAPASGQRSAAPRNSAGQFAGPTPLGDIIGKR